MMRYVKFICLLLFYFHHVNLTFLNEQQVMKNIYKNVENVVELNAHNLNHKFFGKNHSWLVQFYKIPCETCLHSSILFKNLAYNVSRTWNGLIKFAVMDCTDDVVTTLCKGMPIPIIRDPVIRYFHDKYLENSTNPDMELEIDYNVTKMQESLLKVIVTDQKRGFTKNFPNLRPYNEASAMTILKKAPKSTNFVVLMFLPKYDCIGPEIVMDLWRLYPQIYVRYSYNAALKKLLKIVTIPTTLIMTAETKTYRRYVHVGNNIIGTVKIVKEFLKTKKAVKKPQTPTKKATNAFWDYYEKQKLREEVKKMRDPLFYIDLESAFRWSVKNDIATNKIIETSKFNAFVDYLNVVSKLFPFRRNGRAFIAELKYTLKTSMGRIHGSEILKMFTNVETFYKDVFIAPEEWLACDRDTFISEMYSCGLWKLFHYFTVEAAKLNDTKYSSPDEVITTMQSYAENFIKCDNCPHNSIRIVLNYATTNVDTYDEAIIWLWSAHNAANKRLYEEEGADVEFPKIQFPSTKHCPKCRNIDNTWNIQEVLKYLKSVYSLDLRKKKNVMDQSATLRNSKLFNQLPYDNVEILRFLDRCIQILLAIVLMLVIYVIIDLLYKNYYGINYSKLQV